MGTRAKAIPEVPYEHRGRTRQKQRTRDLLVASARDLIGRGEVPTVEQAAAAADISRTTAYRYFPTQRALLLAAHPMIGSASLLPPAPPKDAAARLELVLDEMARIIIDNEAQLRTSLRLSLEATPEERAGLLLRQGRAIRWIEEALEPLRGSMSAAARRDLAIAIRSAAGVEAFVWLVDVAGLSRRRAVQVLRRSATALLRDAVARRG